MAMDLEVWTPKFVIAGLDPAILPKLGNSIPKKPAAAERNMRFAAAVRT